MLLPCPAVISSATLTLNPAQDLCASSIDCAIILIPASSPEPTCEPGCAIKNGTPSSSHRSNSSMKPPTERWRSFSSGAPRFSRYESCATTIRMPVSACARLKAAASSSVNGFEAHWREDLVKIWMHSHPASLPRARASLTPPAMDMCAPRSGRFSSSFTVDMEESGRPRRLECHLIRTGGQSEKPHARGALLAVSSARGYSFSVYRIRFAVPFLCAAFAAGCARTAPRISVLSTEHVMVSRVIASDVEPKDPDCELKQLDSIPSSGARDLGIIRLSGGVSDSSLKADDALKFVHQRACEMGADAIMIEQKKQGEGDSAQYQIIAHAIAYPQSSGQAGPARDQQHDKAEATRARTVEIPGEAGEHTVEAPGARHARMVEIPMNGGPEAESVQWPQAREIPMQAASGPRNQSPRPSKAQLPAGKSPEAQVSAEQGPAEATPEEESSHGAEEMRPEEMRPEASSAMTE